MNIFYLHHCPYQCAEWLVDKHVVKMILETAQLLSTAHRLLDGENRVLPDERENVLYRATHANHPSAVWVRKSVENYNWTVDHLFALGSEYSFRYGRVHKTMTMDRPYLLQSPPLNLKEYDWTEMPSCMPDEYKISDDPILNYREYYRKGKAHLHKWKMREVPSFIGENNEHS